MTVKLQAREKKFKIEQNVVRNKAQKKAEFEIKRSEEKKRLE
jgi:hypothetical protein